MVNINGGSPTHFRSKGGREYYLFAKEGSYSNYKKGIFWVINEIEMSERELYLNKYIKVDKNTKTDVGVGLDEGPESITDETPGTP